MVIFLLPLLLGQHFNAYIKNILNGGFAVWPAALMVIWQVHKENEARILEDKKNHDDEMARIKRNHKNELKKIERNHNDEIKRNIYELLACMNDFPEIFSIKYRIGIVAQENGDYKRVLSLKDDLIDFKKEFHRESIKLQSHLIYLSDEKDQQENLTTIISQFSKIEHYLQKLINILNKENLEGGLGYTEKDYEEIITNMCSLKKSLRKLPENISLNNEFMDINTKNLDYYGYVIKCSKKYLQDIYNKQNELSVQILKDSLNPDIVNNLTNRSKEEKINKDEAFRDCLKIWALSNDLGDKRDYTYTNKPAIRITRTGKQSTISRFVGFN